MREWAQYSVEEAGGRATVIVTGPLLVSSIGKLDRELRDYSESVQAIDITDAHPIDTVGAWIIYRFAERTGADIVGASEQAEVLIEAVESASSDAEIAPSGSGAAACLWTALRKARPTLSAATVTENERRPASFAAMPPSSFPCSSTSPTSARQRDALALSRTTPTRSRSLQPPLACGKTISRST